MENQNGGIPVDNSQFSTFSTVLSTRVFHRGGDLWIFIFGSHKTMNGISQKPHFFRDGGFLPWRFLCAKKQVLTGSSRKAGGAVPGQWEKNSKRGLILFPKDAIMCVCMESQHKEVKSMPNIKSSKKDVISSKIAYEKNKANKSELKTNLKKFDAAVVSGDKAAAEAAYKVAVKAVDQAVVKGLLHKNNAARKKSSMTLQLNKLA